MAYSDYRSLISEYCLIDRGLRIRWRGIKPETKLCRLRKKSINYSRSSESSSESNIASATLRRDFLLSMLRF